MATTTATTMTTGGETSVVERTRKVSVWDLKPFLKKYTFEESTHDEEKRLMLVAQPTVSPSSSSSSSSSSLETTRPSAAAQVHQGQGQGHGHGKKKEPEYTETQVDENGCAIVLWNRLLFPKKKKSDEGIISNRYLYMHPEDREPEAPKISTIEKLFAIKKTVVIMCHGGYFAAGVFDKARLVAHKTFHSYIVRRKQGGRQSNRDKNGRRPKSGGAQIRRHNEEKHLLNVRALVNSWADHLTECDLILTHLPSHNKTLLIDKEREVSSSSSHGAKQHQGHDKEEDFFLSKNDPRLRTIPFATHRPSLSEVKRVFLELTTALLVTFEAPPSTQLLPISGSSSSSINLRTSADPSALVDELRSSGDWEPSFKTRTSDDDEDEDDDEDRDDDDDHEGNSDQDGDEEDDDEDDD